MHLVHFLNNIEIYELGIPLITKYGSVWFSCEMKIKHPSSLTRPVNEPNEHERGVFMFVCLSLDEYEHEHEHEHEHLNERKIMFVFVH